jgi:hypothetical protein
MKQFCLRITSVLWATSASLLLLVYTPVAAQNSLPSSLSADEQRLLRALSGNVHHDTRSAATHTAQSGVSAEIIGLCRRQKDAGDAIRAQLLTKKSIATTAPRVGVAGQLGAGSAPLNSRNGNPQTPARQNVTITPAPSAALCGPLGIRDVNGLSIGTIFTPITPYNSLVIRGCGFGQTMGKVFIDPKYDPAPGAQRSIYQASRLQLGRSLQLVVQNANWNNDFILVDVDTNTSGYLESENVTLQVETAQGQQYQAHGFKFYPVYEEQVLPNLVRTMPRLVSSGSLNSPPAPSGADRLAQVRDANGSPVQANFLSPSAGSEVFDPNHTLAVVRLASAVFGSGTDIFDLAPRLKQGFDIHQKPKLFTATLPPDFCGGSGMYTTNGNWDSLFSGLQVQISWQAQGCQVLVRNGNPQTPSSHNSHNIAKAPPPAMNVHSSGQGGSDGVSAYAADIFVRGPRGVSPLP